MRQPSAYTSWKITCRSSDDSRALQQWLSSRIDLDRIFTDTVRAVPNGVEKVQTVGHRLGDYFVEITMVPDPQATPAPFRLVFHKRLEAGRFWKDLMVNILQEIEATPQKASINLESKGELLSGAEIAANESEVHATQPGFGDKSISWEYPIYAIETGPNQVRMLIGEGDDCGEHALLVFQTKDAVIAYTAASQTSGTVRQFEDEGAFYQLLRGLDRSASVVLFNPEVTGNATPISYEWQVSIDALLISYFSHILDERDYPLYAVSAGSGYVCLRGPTKNGTTDVNAICVFTDEDLANRYVARSSIPGVVQEITTSQEFRRLLKTRTDVQGVCFDSMPVERTWRYVPLVELVSRLSAAPGPSLAAMITIETAAGIRIEKVSV